MDGENVVAHVLAQLPLQNFHVPDVVLLNLPLAQAEKNNSSALISVSVSYTHLTLPTKLEV